MLLGLLVGLAVQAAACNVPLGVLLAWGFAGGDGEVEYPLAAVLGLGVLAATVGALVAALGLLERPLGFAAIVWLVVAAVAIGWFLSTHEDDRARRWMLLIVLVTGLALAVVPGVLRAATPVTSQALALVAAPPIVTAVTVVLTQPNLMRDDRRAAATVLGMLCLPLALLGAGHVVG